MEVRVTVHTPWQLWTFLERSPRVEILYHSIHYVDLVRSFLGEPRGVQAKTVKNPKMTRLASTCTAIILEYGEEVRVNITANHGHEFGPKHQESYVKWEGGGGAIKAYLGALVDYPRGEPDGLEYCTLDRGGRPSKWRESRRWRATWFPHAFIGPMSDLMRYADGETGPPPTSVADAFKTMAVVEAAYRASRRGGVPPSKK